MQYPALAQDIIALKNADLELREKLIQRGQLGEGYNEAMKQLHDRNAEALREIMDTIGYPTIDKVGEAAGAAAWLVIQHAIGQPDFMRACAKLLAHAVAENKANPKDLAYLTDRIAVLTGSPQPYGTQFDWNEHGQLVPQPFDDLTKVNQRREKLGLNTLAEQTAIIRQRAETENQKPPADFAKRQKEIEEWKRSTGWIT